MDRIRYELLNTRLEIYEQTFRNIHAEIYDNIGQQLSLCKLYLSSPQEEMSDVTAKKIHDVRVLIGQSISDLRDLSREHIEETIRSTGLITTLKRQFQIMQKQVQFELHLDVSDELTEPDNDRCLILYAMLLEVLNNVARHARATEVRMRVYHDNQQWQADIRDNGLGYNTRKRYNGNGIRKMRRRASVIGANLRIDSKPGMGTVVYLSLPLKSVS